MSDYKPVPARAVLHLLPKLYSQFDENHPCNWSNHVTYNKYADTITINALGYPTPFEKTPNNKIPYRYLYLNEAFDPVKLADNFRSFKPVNARKLPTREAYRRTNIMTNSIFSIGLTDYDSQELTFRDIEIVMVPPKDLPYVTCAGWRYFKGITDPVRRALPMDGYDIDEDCNIVYECNVVQPDNTFERHVCHNHNDLWNQMNTNILEGATYLVTQYVSPEGEESSEYEYSFIVWLLSDKYPVEDLR